MGDRRGLRIDPDWLIASVQRFPDRLARSIECRRMKFPRQSTQLSISRIRGALSLFSSIADGTRHKVRTLIGRVGQDLPTGSKVTPDGLMLLSEPVRIGGNGSGALIGQSADMRADKIGRV